MFIPQPCPPAPSTLPPPPVSTRVTFVLRVIFLPWSWSECPPWPDKKNQKRIWKFFNEACSAAARGSLGPPRPGRLVPADRPDPTTLHVWSALSVQKPVGCAQHRRSDNSHDIRLPLPSFAGAWAFISILGSHGFLSEQKAFLPPEQGAAWRLGEKEAASHLEGCFWSCR